MLEVKVARIYRETLTVTEEKEVGASDITEQVKQIVKRSRINDGRCSARQKALRLKSA